MEINETVDDRFPMFDSNNSYVGECMLMGKYVVFDCPNELEALETFHHFKQAEQTARTPDDDE